MGLTVGMKSIDDILRLLDKGEWQTPEFQRDFTWSPDQVKDLVDSILKNYPIGLITTWDQPQSKPHTTPAPFKLKGVSYGHFKKNPAVMKLVIDGKQRLTALAMVFGGFSSSQGKYCGEWFLDLGEYITPTNKDNLVQMKPPAQIAAQNLNTISSCILQKMIPFKDLYNLAHYIAAVSNPATYPTNGYPSNAKMNIVINALKSIQNTYLSFSIPFAEIPNSIPLGDVCDVFNVLNTTGTRVSTFDLIHNLLFKASSKPSRNTFNLRDQFEVCKNTYLSLGLLCDDKRQDFLCQLVTGCYLAIGGVGNNKKKPITSIKGPDLIETPLPFYDTLFSNLKILDGFAADFFTKILGVNISLSELPYPASSIIYFALRWKMHTGQAQYSVVELNSLFKAFFWRNVLSTRYDQGFLTKLSTDLKELDSILVKHHAIRKNTSWIKNCNTDLDTLFGTSFPPKNVKHIYDTLLDETIGGALRQLYIVFIKSITKHDIVDNTLLNWGTNSEVQVHHIFPQNWCTNNKGKHPAVTNYGADHFANKTPLKANTNISWQAKSPTTAIKKHGITFTNHQISLQEAFIDATTFSHLQKDNPKTFWERRADCMANLIHAYQYVK